SFRLLAVGAQCDLKLLEVEAERPAAWIVYFLFSGACELRSLRVLSFVAGRCRLLLNSVWLLQLQWPQAEEQPRMSSCCGVQLTESERHAAVDHCVCRGTLFVLSSAGLITVHDVTDGRLLASVDLPAYLNSALPEEDSVSSSSSFYLLQVSGDLSTAVAVTQSHAAVAVNLDHYFRYSSRSRNLQFQGSRSQLNLHRSHTEPQYRLMLFGSAATVDVVCHLNSWGRCSIPIHALQAGLKNRQLDTVDFYLKSKENVLHPSAVFGAADQPVASSLSLTDRVQELCPALDLLCSAVRDSNSDAQSRQFSEQLLNITSNFINTQIRRVLSDTHFDEAGVRCCVAVLDRYVTELRSYMKRFPWPAGGDTSSRHLCVRPVCVNVCVLQEVVRRSILTNQIPRAQAVLRRRSCPEQRLSALRMEGLRQVLSSLQLRDLQTANRLLTNMSCCPDSHTQVYQRPEHHDRNANKDSDSVHKELYISALLELHSCESAVLWRYLTALHDQQRVVSWIQNSESNEASRWPELTPELVNSNTMCSSYLRENILDLLARTSVFIPEELADLEQLLWRLAQGGGVMASPPPVPQYRSPVGMDLHSLFITFCLDHGQQYLLYTYLEHYRLTPRNCPLLTNQSLSESLPWFEMLVKIQEITRDLSDPALLFQASLTSAQVLLPGSQASLSSLLLEGHSLLALAAIMFAPGGIDQVVAQGERSGRSERSVDPQLLKMALSPHPKLKAALFPAGPRGNSPSSDISVYHLLQSLHPLDPSRLFGWQVANTLNSTETSELPHFSSPQLVSRFALVENLDFLYYLHHGRPSFAFATFLVQQLRSCSDVSLVQRARQQAYRLALQCFHVPPVASAAVCFYELLGVCSLQLRVDIRAMNVILQHWDQHDTHTAATHLHTLGKHNALTAELIGYLEAAVTDSLERKGISRSSYEAAQEWALPVQFCQLHGLKLSSVYPAHCADDGQLIHFLLFVQLHNFPPQQVRSLAAQFGPALQAHLSLAFQDLQVYRQRRSCDPEVHTRTLSTEEAPRSPGHPRDMFQVLLQSQEEASPCRHLLQEALVQRCPTLAVLAACQQGAELLPCLCVWVLTSIDDVTSGEATAHLLETPQHHDWTLHDLSIIWRTLLGRGHVRPLLRGFKLFQRDCPLVLVLRMFELCCDYRNFPEAKAKLLDFQRTLITVSVTQQHLSPRLLQSTSPSIQQVEFQAAVDALQARGRYSQARQVALLAGLPVHQLLLSQVCSTSKRHWRRLETRVSFWRKCHEQLKADSTDPESASQFFLSQTGTECIEAQMELLDVQECCLLLGLAAHWLSLLSPAPVDKLESLEKELWVSRVRGHTLTVAMERESLFNLPPPAVTPEMNTYEALMKEFSFSNISGLRTDKCLSMEGLPASPEEQEQLNVSSGWSPEERSVLVALVGQLLDDGSIHEASRVCRYFSLYHPDMWVVLRCRGLASGEPGPEPGPEALDTLPRNTPSFSSLSSFVMLPALEDEVSVQLQRLVDQCRHGNNYCKQVLSLYQLSKELQCSFAEICREEPVSVLEKLLLSEQPERFRKAQAFIRAQGLSADTVAELVATAVVQALLASTQELQTAEKQVVRLSEGHDSLVQLIRLCEDPNLVGVKLLENLSTVPLRDLSCIVELLIVAHDCFSLTCNMEGIVRVLQAARHLSHTYLAPREQYSLLVRLLTGIGRYNEMTYVFDLLHQNHRFEMLLRKKVDTDGLKTALLDYIKRCLPADSEKHNMVALCFTMRREIGENHEMAARTQLKIIESQAWGEQTPVNLPTHQLKSSLIKVLGLLKDAAESFSKDSCVRQASRCVRMAKLVALQLHFLNQGSDLRVINLRPAELQKTVVELPRCYQVFVLSEAYGYSPDWAEILYCKVILTGDFAYLEELKRHRPLTSSLFEDVFKKLDGAPSSVTVNVKRLLTHCDDVYSRYRLAYQQHLHDVTKTMLQDAKTSSYLNDRLSS
uniref:SPG11 vesicle trafficking associated, spatacsin n=1 Tax=Mastacembelus armatus TaxID=205130 RepID=A0A3Q3M7Z9_9TELE